MKQLQRIGAICLLSLMAIVSKAEDITATWDFKDNTVVNDVVALSGSKKAGTINAIQKNGILLTLEANGKTIRKAKNGIETDDGVVFKVPVKSNIDIVTVVGVDTAYAYSIAGKNATKATTAYTANDTDVKNGFVQIINKGKYLVSISVVQKQKEPEGAKNDTLNKLPVKATFAFNLGTTGQKADFGTAATHFIANKVTLGSNLVIKGADKKTGQTLIEPLTQQSGKDESNTIRFLIQPDFGLTFTPTKVTLKTTRYGTDNGNIDVSWQNANKTVLSLGTGVKPNRDNNTGNVTNLTYNLSGAAAGEGTCGIIVNLYNLEKGKQIGFSDIVIEGTLTGIDRDWPILASLTINGKSYSREELFDDDYEGFLEIRRTDKMVSKDNPVNAIALKGKIGTITYEGDSKLSKVVIPMSHGENKVSYTLNVARVTTFKLTYIDTDGETILSQGEREKGEAIGAFDVEPYDVSVKNGYKMRGWCHTPEGGQKYTVKDVVNEDIILYALATEIEEISTNKRYTFDLTDKYFDPEDHEAFSVSGKGYHWLDSQHGWAFQDGNKIDLLVGPKANIRLAICQYSQGDRIYVKSEAGDTLTVLNTNIEEEGDITSFKYEGKGGTISLYIKAPGEVYIHSIKIINTSESCYDNYGNWFIVNPGKVTGLTNALEELTVKNAKEKAERSFIFLPNGTYDLEETVKTAITGYNISIIGQSKDSTIIVTKPDVSLEGLGSTDMLTNNSKNLYLQDLTLKNALDYYNAGQSGSATVLYDAGDHTIGKNVKMLSYQDTYYSFNNGMQSYWEDCDIHGAVDFIRGGGDVWFQNTTLSLEPRSRFLKGNRSIATPRTMTDFGFVFDNCRIVDLADGNDTWTFGCAWANHPIAVYLNTTLGKNAENTLSSTRWTEKGMNNTDPYVFGEYNTMDIDGNNITPESNAITSYSGIYQTILIATQTAFFTYEKMFSKNATKKWDPATMALQVDAPADAKYDSGSITWSAVKGAIAYAIFKSGKFVAMTDGTSYNLEVNPDLHRLSIRSANAMGGLGPEAHVAGTTDIKTINTKEGEDVIYNLQGIRVKKAGKGIYIINGKKTIVR